MTVIESLHDFSVENSGKRNHSRNFNKEDRTKVVMVSSSDRETVKAGPAYDSGVELFTPPTPQNSAMMWKNSNVNSRYKELVTESNDSFEVCEECNNLLGKSKGIRRNLEQIWHQPPQEFKLVSIADSRATSHYLC
ncbi:unnamed protein product [Psylliodes chrysocephalus]|uniref:Uncharacterized protein n=1 Tax=Psylliodes chrysocephalus TaxID=3402493 RepID=A0A9P0GBB5_9CUCU|nr:unnamed protein product [Psylliodes chrysocephala]